MRQSPASWRSDSSRSRRRSSTFSRRQVGMSPQCHCEVAKRPWQSPNCCHKDRLEIASSVFDLLAKTGRIESSVSLRGCEATVAISEFLSTDGSRSPRPIGLAKTGQVLFLVKTHGSVTRGSTIYRSAFTSYHEKRKMWVSTMN